MTTVSVILTCYNRKEKTISCIESLSKGNKTIQFQFIVVDDNSNDGTVELIQTLEYDIKVLTGTGNLYWSGGMRKGIEYYLENNRTDYVLLVNDDVAFFEESIEAILEQSKNKNSVVVGATCSDDKEFTYGAIRLKRPRKNGWYYHVKPRDREISSDTFNANCVLILDEVIRDVGNLDKVYNHSLADLDYGLMVSRKGYNIISSSDYVGVCNRNSIKGGWLDTTLSRWDRVKKKESIKGAPFKEWFYFMNKNFGLLLAIRYSLSPYIRILFGK